MNEDLSDDELYSLWTRACEKAQTEPCLDQETFATIITDFTTEQRARFANSMHDILGGNVKVDMDAFGENWVLMGMGILPKGILDIANRYKTEREGESFD